MTRTWTVTFVDPSTKFNTTSVVVDARNTEEAARMALDQAAAPDGDYIVTVSTRRAVKVTTIAREIEVAP